MRARHKRHPAFTLMELILVMMILAIAIAMLAPTLRGFGVGRRTSDTANRIVTLAEYAHGQAISEARTYRLNFDVKANAFWLTAQSDGVFQQPSGDFGDRYQSPDGVRLQCDVAPQPDGQYVEFRATGRSDPARVHLTDQLGNRIDIACPSATELFRVLTPQETR